jgi:hypothetical protein
VDGVNLITAGGWIVALIVAVLPITIARIWEPYRLQRYIWKFSGASRDQPRIIIEHIRLKDEPADQYSRPNAGFGAVAAVLALSTALNASRRGLFRRVHRSLEKPIELGFSSEGRADGWGSDHDTVVMGGPKHNGITEEVLRAFGCQPPGHGSVSEDELVRLTRSLRGDGEVADGLGVATRVNTIFWFGDRYTGKVENVDSPGSTSKYAGDDYGVVLRVPSPTNAASRMVVIFGSQTFGVQAASSWLVNVPTHGRRDRSLMARHRNIAVLVKASVVDGVVGDAQLIEIVPLPDDLRSRGRS